MWLPTIQNPWDKVSALCVMLLSLSGSLRFTRIITASMRYVRCGRVAPDEEACWLRMKNEFL